MVYFLFILFNFIIIYYMADIYQSTLDRIQSIIESQRFKLLLPDSSEPDPETFRFAIITKRKEKVAIITTHVSTGDIVLGKTRDTDIQEETPVFSVTWLGTNEGYQGRGFGILLLIYALCYLKQHNPNTNYSILDDDSARNQNLIDNIYTSLGYVFQDTIALNMAKKNKIIISSPERQLRLDTDFLERVNKLLDEKFPIRAGNRKSRKNMKSRKSRKSRKT